jgi:cytochrome b561
MPDAACPEPALDNVSPPKAGRVAGGTGFSTTEVAAAPAYTMTARILHWVMAIVIVSMIPLGLVIANDWGGPLQEPLYNPHRSVGLLIIPLISLRLIHRLANPPLRLPENIPGMQRLAAHATHGCLYALLIVQPVIGWIATSAYRAPISEFGWFDSPPIRPENRPFSEQMSSIHGLIGTAIAGLVAIHIGGALFHHFVRKDRVLIMRMVTC